MRITFLTIFPSLIENALNISILKRAKESGAIEYNVVNLRDFTTDNYKTIDDHPYGGGAGMVMMIEPVYKGLESIIGDDFNLLLEKKLSDTAVILLTPKGKTWKQEMASEFSRKYKHVVFIVPHFEGIDERVAENLVTHEISIGDYVLTGGELPSLIITDSIVRLIPDVLGNSQSIVDETFNDNLLEYPQYTRPSIFKPNDKEWKVPDVLLSGNHKQIEEWRSAKRLEETKKRRIDLIKKN